MPMLEYYAQSAYIPGTLGINTQPDLSVSLSESASQALSGIGLFLIAKIRLPFSIPIAIPIPTFAIAVPAGWN
jgi:hypothetical protein